MDLVSQIGNCSQYMVAQFTMKMPIRDHLGVFNVEPDGNAGPNDETRAEEFYEKFGRQLLSSAKKLRLVHRLNSVSCVGFGVAFSGEKERKFMQMLACE